MKKIIEKAAVLIEALPYIQRFRGAMVVVKYGGSAMRMPRAEGILRDIVFMECVGMRPVVVHGGGEAITKRLREGGVTPRFVGGLRVTDAPTMHIVEQVLGEVNGRIVERLNELGGRAKGLTWADEIIVAKKHLASIRRGSRKEKVDIGFVGDVKRVKAAPLRALCGKDIIPVLTPLGVDERGERYNINADTAAGAVAAALKARKLVLLTDVLGIMRKEGDAASLIETLHLEDVDGLIEKGVIREGMLPKVEAAVRAAMKGVRKTHIIDGRLPHSLLLELFTDRGIGTEIVEGERLPSPPSRR